MRRARCPYCNNVNVIAEEDWGQINRCEAPRCGRIFQSGAGTAVSSSLDGIAPAPPRRRPPPPVSVPPPQKPRLTGPHICHACKGEIHQALGHRRATIVHRLPASGDRPAGDPCRMDIYAAIYFCPSTHCHALLETPSYQCGSIVACPTCSTEFAAPLDNVLHEHEGDSREGQVFHFRCPSCSSTLRCDSTREGQPTTGLRVVCLFCRNIIEVPAGGILAGTRPAGVPDTCEVLHNGGERRCSNPACARLIPSRAEHCPLCSAVQIEDGVAH